MNKYSIAVLACCVLVSLPGAVAWAEAASEKRELVITVSDVRHRKGIIGCALFASTEGFPLKDKLALQRVRVPIRSNKVTCRFVDVPPGKYAVAVMHDENSNGKLDTTLVGRPKEGWGVSNNVPMRRFGPPRYEAAQFKYEGEVLSLTIRLRY